MLSSSAGKKVDCNIELKNQKSVLKSIKLPDLGGRDFKLFLLCLMPPKNVNIWA